VSFQGGNRNKTWTNRIILDHKLEDDAMKFAVPSLSPSPHPKRKKEWTRKKETENPCPKKRQREKTNGKKIKMVKNEKQTNIPSNSRNPQLLLCKLGSRKTLHASQQEFKAPISLTWILL